MKTWIALALAGALAVSTSGALAQETPGGMDHGAMGMEPMKPDAAADAPSSKAFAAASEKMHATMGARLTGDPDLDFLQGMIPHHQGAIDMARIELEHGRDPKVKALAQKIIAAQEAEIAEMERWIAEMK